MNSFDLVVRLKNNGELINVYPFKTSGSLGDEWVEAVRKASPDNDDIFFVVRSMDVDGLRGGTVNIEEL